MTSLLGAKTTQAAATPVAGGVNVQTSALGKCIPIVMGANKISPNLIDYLDFKATKQSTGGGKGGVAGGGGGKGGGGSSSYLYSATVLLGLCEGPITGIGTIWKDKNVTTAAALGMSTFLGTYPQDPWDYLVSKYSTSGTLTTTVPLTPPYQVRVCPANQFIDDGGVTGQSSHATFTRVTHAPTSGQYEVLQSGATTQVYLFNSADKGKKVAITYLDGYNRTSQTANYQIPTSAPYQIRVQGQYGYPVTDKGVASINIGYIPVGSSPASGQYTISGGLYTFNAANAGAAVTIKFASTTTTGNYRALGYNGLAYLAAPNYQLGTSPNISNHQVEIFGLFYQSAGTFTPDADASLVVTGLLDGDPYGVGFPSDMIGDLTDYQNYTIASGLLFSPAYTDQQQASAMLTDLATLSNSQWLWANGALTLVPLGDSTITGHGKTYTPDLTPLFDLTDDDFVVESAGDDPIQLDRMNIADAVNIISLEILDRGNQYNTAIVQVKDEARIEQYGEKPQQTVQAHQICSPSIGQVSANLMLSAQGRMNTYTFTLKRQYMVLDPLDLVTLTDVKMGLDRELVRIQTITENSDGTFTMTAQEMLVGSATAEAEYGFQDTDQYSANYNETPNDINPPVLFEPTAQLAQELAVWLAISGADNWGGTDVWLSTDGNTYQYIDRVVKGGSRTGSLTADLPTFTAASQGQTIDTVNTLSVDLTECDGQLLTASNSDALALSTLMYVDGEFIAYQNATLTDVNNYDLSYLVRGCYESTISDHVPGARMCRVDSSIIKIPYASNQVGQTIYLKFASYNIFGGGQPTLDTLTPYTYVLQGTAFKSPLDAPANLRTTYVGDITQITWDEVQDFRPILYEIRKGDTWESSQVLGRYAHPPFNVLGDDSYWVAARTEPVAGVVVYSDPEEIIIDGASLVSNVIASHDERATGWTGTLSGSAYIDGDDDVSTGGGGDILGIPDILAVPDILDYGGDTDGIYTIPSGHRIFITTPTACLVNVTWQSRGDFTDDDILNIADILAVTDILNGSASPQVSVFPEIRLSQDGGSTWGDWQKYVAGYYIGDGFDFRMDMTTQNPQVRAILSQFMFSVDVPDRTDHYTNVALLAGGSTITFSTDAQRLAGSGTAAFNGGNAGAVLPGVQVTILNAQTGDDVIVTSLSLSHVTVQVTNLGIGVIRNVNIVAQGY